jgi:hypothetical protein
MEITEGVVTVSEKDFNLEVERKAKELIEIQDRNLRAATRAAIPTNVTEEEYMRAESVQNIKEQLGEPVEEEMYDEHGDPIPPDDVLAARAKEIEKAERVADHGFSIRGTQSLTVQFNTFKAASGVFMQVNKFEAIYIMFHSYMQAFIEWTGGYGLNDNKKKTFLEEVDRLDQMFQHLKGEARRRKEYADLRRFVDTYLFRRINQISWAVMMDTKDAREKDEHERLMRLSEGFSGDWGDYREISQNIGGGEDTSTEEEFWKMD